MDECCAKGHVHCGTPQGSEVKIAGLDAYAKRSPNYRGKAILYLADAMGWVGVNSRLLVDYFSEQLDVLVIMPNYLGNDMIPASILEGEPFDVMAWVNRQLPKPDTFKDIVRTVQILESEHRVTSLGVIGYCWGSWGSLELGVTDLVQAVMVAHPSLLNFPHDIQVLKQPTLFLCAEMDNQFGTEQRKEAEAILSQRQTIPHRFVYYPGTEHGFAARGDITDGPTAAAYHDARQQAVAWFKQYLK